MIWNDLFQFILWKSCEFHNLKDSSFFTRANITFWLSDQSRWARENFEKKSSIIKSDEIIILLGCWHLCRGATLRWSHKWTWFDLHRCQIRWNPWNGLSRDCCSRYKSWEGMDFIELCFRCEAGVQHSDRPEESSIPGVCFLAQQVNERRSQ